PVSFASGFATSDMSNSPHEGWSRRIDGIDVLEGCHVAAQRGRPTHGAGSWNPSDGPEPGPVQHVTGFDRLHQPANLLVPGRAVTGRSLHASSEQRLLAGGPLDPVLDSPKTPPSLVSRGITPSLREAPSALPIERGRPPSWSQRNQLLRQSRSDAMPDHY